MIYVVGNARSGTNSIAKILKCANNTTVFHEGNVYPWLRLEEKGYKNEDCCSWITKYIPPQWAKKAEGAGKIAVDSNHYISPLIRQVHKLRPKIRFIYLLRNPADIIRSWMNLKFPMNDDFLTTTLYERYRWRPFPKEITRRFVRLCHYWRATNEKINDSLVGTDHIAIKIEEIECQLQRIWEWAELEGGMEEAEARCSVRYNTRKSSLKPPFPYFDKWEKWRKDVYDEIVRSSSAFKYSGS